MTQCYAPLNAAYFTNLTAQINAAQTAAELQALVDGAFHDLSLLESTITSQIAFLGPILALLAAPAANPAAIVTWITSYITSVLTPLVAPYAIYAAQLTALTAEVTALTSAINARGLGVSIPSVGVICTL